MMVTIDNLFYKNRNNIKNWVTVIKYDPFLKSSLSSDSEPTEDDGLEDDSDYE